MNPLTTPEVLRLLEGGNESPLAKYDLVAALFLARAVPGSESTFMAGCLIPSEVEIPSEVVTRELGPTWVETVGQFEKHGDRPAIVISTQE